MEDKLTASEALYGFAAWLTTRKEPVTFSEHHDAAIAATLVDEFCKENKLAEPREHWHTNLVHPSGECSTESVPEPESKINAFIKRWRHLLFNCPTFWRLKPAYTCPCCGKKYRCYWDGNDTSHGIDYCHECTSKLEE